MRVGQRVTQRQRQIDDLRRGEASLIQDLLQRLPLDQLERDVVLAVCVPDLVDRGDVGVIQ